MKYHAMTAALLALLTAIPWMTAVSCSRSESATDPRCEELEKSYDAVLSAASGSCTNDADCTCYGQSTTRSQCGGVTDRKTAAALEAIAKEFHSRKCPRGYRCAAWKCVPACHKGACVTDQLKKTVEKNQGR